MNLNGRNLFFQEPYQTGDDVALLQYELSQLGFNIPVEEKKNRLFGNGTRQAVIEFQRKHDLNSSDGISGVVGELTVALINSELAKLFGDNRHKSFIVRGLLSDDDGNPVSGALVLAFDRYLGNEERQLGEATTGQDGTYEITYHDGQLRRLQKESVALIVRAKNPTTGEYFAKSSIIYNAPTLVTVDLVVSGGKYRRPSEYKHLFEIISPLLNGRSWDEIKEEEVNIQDDVLDPDNKIRDVTLLAGKTGEDPQRVAFLIIANRLGQQKRISPEALYGLFRQGLPSFLPALLAQNQNVQRRALETAIHNNIISFKLQDEIGHIVERLRQLIIEQAFEQPKEKENASLGDLLMSSMAYPLANHNRKVLVEKFLRLYVQHQGPIEKFWENIRRDKEFRGNVDNMQLSLQLGALSWNYRPLMNEIQRMQQEGKVKSIRDLARLDVDDWINIIDKQVDDTGGIVGFPKGITGKDPHEKVKNYANIIVRIIEDAFPTAVIANRLKKEDMNIPAKNELINFLDKNPGFELRSTYIENYIKQHPDTLESVQDKPVLKANLKRLQRVFKLTPRYSEMRVLLADDLNSAYTIKQMSKNVFIKKYSKPLGDANHAKIIYENAIQMSAMATDMYMKYNQSSNDISMQVLEGNEQQLMDDDSIPDWETLFGTFNLCQCEHCRSALSPAAYLADILHFLSGRQSKLSDKNAKDILFERRPDIGEIELTCENTNTPLPYVDLVNEILENAIISLYFTLNATEYQSVFDNETILPPELVLTFKKNGFVLSDEASISIEEIGNKWSITDLGARFVVKKQLDKLEVSFYPQTGWIAGELAANSEHINNNVYTKKLAEQIYPWQLPFDLFAEEARAHLDHLGILRYKLIETFPKTGLVESIVDKTLAREYFELTEKELKIITGLATENAWEYWGYPSDVVGSGTWTDDLRQVRVFLQKSGLSYQELVKLLKTKYINPNRTLSIGPSAESNQITCDTSKLFINGPDFADGTPNRIHRFVRLYRKLGWTMLDLDKTITSITMKPGDINETFVLELYFIQKLHKELDTPIIDILSWYSQIDTAVYKDHDDHQDQELSKQKSLYEQLFQNPSVIVLDPDPFLLNSNRDQLEKVSILTEKNILSALVAAFSINESDLILLVNGSGSSSMSSKQLNLTNLSTLYRNVSFARALELSIQDLLNIKNLTGINPFVNDSGLISPDNLKSTWRFVQVVQKIRTSGFNIAELDYLLRSKPIAESEIIPPDENIAVILDEIRKGLQKIHAETKVVPDSTGDLIKKKLISLKWPITLVEQVISTLNGSMDYKAIVSSKPPALDPKEKKIQEKMYYDEVTKMLHFVGAMTEAEKTILLSKPGDGFYRSAINNLFDAPREFLIKKMKAFELPTFSTALSALPVNVEVGAPVKIAFPSDLNNKIYFDSQSGELRFAGAMTDAEKAVLLSLSTDTTYTAAINVLADMPDMYVPEPKNHFILPTDVKNLFDSGDKKKSVEQRYHYVLEKLMLYLRELLSKNLVGQKLCEAFKIQPKMINDLLIHKVDSPDDPSYKKVIEEFLDFDFSGSNINVNLTSKAFPSQFRSYTLLHKISLVLSKFKVRSQVQLSWLFDYRPDDGDDLPWLNLNLLLDDSISVSDRFAGWERLVDLFQLRNKIKSGETVLTEMLASSHTPDANVGNLDLKEKNLIKTLSKYTGWKEDDLSFLVGDDGFDFKFPKSYKDERSLKQLYGCFIMIKKLGVSAQQCIAYAKPALKPEDSISIKQAVKAKYENDQWLDIARPIRNILREKQRASLVAYLLAHPDPSKNQNWTDVNDLYAYFLIDTEMSPCQMTSRIKQANSSIQLFVQRCFLNLEEDVSTSIIIDSTIVIDEKWFEWKWMKNYRVWEANRKIFLFPENWTEPELRDRDYKSQFFKEMESELLQNDVTKETAEDALLHYIEKLDSVARLEICGMYHQKEAGTDSENSRQLPIVTDVLHIFGRTLGKPHTYYYRRRLESSRWTPWEKVDLDIEGDHLIPVVWNRRLYLFWPIFTEFAYEQHTIPDEGKPGKPPEKYYKIQIAWSEYKSNKWSAKKVADTAEQELQPRETVDTDGNTKFLYQFKALDYQPYIISVFKSESYIPRKRSEIR